MGDADEQAAEEQLEDAPEARPEEAGGVRPAVEAAAEPASAEGNELQLVPADRAGRGPDQIQRVRRSYREGEAQTPDPSDWTSFDISASLRGLRLPMRRVSAGSSASCIYAGGTQAATE